MVRWSFASGWMAECARRLKVYGWLLRVDYILLTSVLHWDVFDYKSFYEIMFYARHYRQCHLHLLFISLSKCLSRSMPWNYVLNKVDELRFRRTSRDVTKVWHCENFHLTLRQDNILNVQKLKFSTPLHLILINGKCREHCYWINWLTLCRRRHLIIYNCIFCVLSRFHHIYHSSKSQFVYLSKMHSGCVRFWSCTTTSSYSVCLVPS